jgi:hypothetical protein
LIIKPPALQRSRDARVLSPGLAVLAAGEQMLLLDLCCKLLRRSVFVPTGFNSPFTSAASKEYWKLPTELEKSVLAGLRRLFLRIDALLCMRGLR